LATNSQSIGSYYLNRGPARGERQGRRCPLAGLREVSKRCLGPRLYGLGESSTFFEVMTLCQLGGLAETVP